MEKWRDEFRFFCKNKIYLWMLSLTAVFSYGFLVTHQTVGIDDTPYTYYFEEGLNVIVGRWLLYLLNKVFGVADFAPFVPDLAGVMILMLAVTVWTVLLRSVLREKVPCWGYYFFACIFLSCPLISEVYTYHLHNGISIGYLCAGVSLCCYKEFLERVTWKKALLPAFGTALFLFVAMGCYESMMIVWLVGLLLVLLSMRYAGEKCKVFRNLVSGAVIAAVAMVFRSLMIAICTAVFDLGAMRDEPVQRSLGEMMGWMFGGAEAFAEFIMALKRVYVMYFAFAYAYYPILIFVLAASLMVVFGIYRAIRKKDAWIAVLTFGCFVASFLLVVIEGSVTLYRAAQFLPLVCGYGVLVLAMIVEEVWQNRGYGVCRGLAIFVLSVILWNQCYDMNRWFYVDWMKYESAVRLVDQIAMELERNFDTSKPIVFTGGYQPPKSIIEDAYVAYGSETFHKINRLTGLVDEHLLEKYYRGDYGVWVAQTPALSVLDWGANAFDGSMEMVKFFAMHGYSIRGHEDMELHEAAQLLSFEWPHFPEAGSIVDMGEYIIVHF